MTIRIAVVGADGEPTNARSFELSYASVGGGAGDAYFVAGLPPGALFVSEGPDGPAVESGPTHIPLVTNELTVVDLGTCKLHVGVFDGRSRIGACPRCGGAIVERAASASYRTMVHRERECVACGASLLELADTARFIGAFSERPESEWVTVAVPMSCPSCGNLLTRTILRTAAGQADIERCVPCALVVLEKKDRVVLGG